MNVPPPKITTDLIESITQGLIKQMAADRLLAKPDYQPAITAMLLNSVLHGKANIESVFREKAKESPTQTVEIRISYHVNAFKPHE